MTDSTLNPAQPSAEDPQGMPVASEADPGLNDAVRSIREVGESADARSSDD